MSLIERKDRTGQPLLPRSDAENAYDLLSDVVTCIRNEPRRLDMGHWLMTGERLDRFLTVKDHLRRGPGCGYAGCCAGWIVMLKIPTERIDFKSEVVETASDDPGPIIGVGHLAARMLDLSDMRDVAKLFEAEVRRWELDPTVEEEPEWEKGVNGELFDHLHYGSGEYVQAVVNRIEKFQRKYETELRAKAV
jgi:hypothetical protein